LPFAVSTVVDIAVRILSNYCNKYTSFSNKGGPQKSPVKDAVPGSA
jgi:hypothetical protein